MDNCTSERCGIQVILERVILMLIFEWGGEAPPHINKEYKFKSLT